MSTFRSVVLEDEELAQICRNIYRGLVSDGMQRNLHYFDEMAAHADCSACRVSTHGVEAKFIPRDPYVGVLNTLLAHLQWPVKVGTPRLL